MIRINKELGDREPFYFRTVFKNMIIRSSIFIFTICLLVALVSCEKEITVDLPEAEQKIVVEGSIFPGEFPLIILTWSQGYFEPTNLSDLRDFFVRGATVSISNSDTTYVLTEFCSSTLTPEFLEIASQALGIPVETLQELDLCLYTNFELRGAVNETYRLQVTKDNHRVSGQTTIPGLVHLDTAYFSILNPEVQDTLGILFAGLTDPDTSGNAYRWFTKRINRYANNVPDEELRGRQKDLTFIAPFGSVNDDGFFNGLSFEFAYPRGVEFNSQKFDDNNEERGYFKVGDTVAIQGCSIDRASFKYIQSMESQISNQGSPFATPFNLESNLHGGLGAFIGYGAIYDTVICAY